MQPRKPLIPEICMSPGQQPRTVLRITPKHAAGIHGNTLWDPPKEAKRTHGNSKTLQARCNSGNTLQRPTGKSAGTLGNTLGRPLETHCRDCGYSPDTLQACSKHSRVHSKNAAGTPRHVASTLQAAAGIPKTCYRYF